MVNEVINCLNAVISALNNVSVSGKQNMLNISGSIDILENLARSLSECTITSKESAQSNKE